MGVGGFWSGVRKVCFTAGVVCSGCSKRRPSLHQYLGREFGPAKFHLYSLRRKVGGQLCLGTDRSVYSNVSHAGRIKWSHLSAAIGEWASRSFPLARPNSCSRTRSEK